MDRRKEWRAAERLLQQGKVDAALAELRKVADGAVADVVTLNRLGDLLARQGRTAEAISHYKKVAIQYEQGGFAPKAIAIHKKILRLDADQLEAAARLGELYVAQNMLGEVRKFLLHAANRHLEKGQLPEARAVFEQLVAAEPDEIRHRVRLAETRAVEGDATGAVEQLLRVGEALLDRDEIDEARKILERAHELEPDSHGVRVGLARCQEHSDQGSEAIESLEGLVAESEATPTALIELARLYVAAGRQEDAFRVAREAPFLEVPADSWFRLLALATEQQCAGPLWEWIDRCSDDAARNRDHAAAGCILRRLAELEEGGHLPAMERLAVLLESSGELRQHVNALDALARTYDQRGMERKAADVRERLRAATPADEEPRQVADSNEATAIEHTSLVEASTPAPPLPAAEPKPAPAAPAAGMAGIDPPAVPLNRSDEEFVSGRVTQAEVLEKYDLMPQALAQLEEALEKFPGHVGAQERRVAMLRGVGSTPRLAEALTDLAVARRAGGDVDRAREAAEEAADHPQLTTASRRTLEALALVPSATPPAQPAEEPVAQPVVEAAPEPTVEAAAVETVDAEQEDEILIDLDGADEPQAATPEPKRQGPREADAEQLADVRIALDAGDVDGARRRLDTLCTSGYAGPKLGALRAAIEEAAEERAEAQRDTEDAVVLPTDDGNDDDLEMIRAALEEELDDDDSAPIIPEEAPDQSVSEILAAFKERVEEEVGSEDHRTHYELGIGFKEMGLLDEAIESFEKVGGGREQQRDARVMLAICHRERGSADEAIRCYRTLLDEGGLEAEAATGLRYDLAELLMDNGDQEGALREFQGVMQSDPAFRDVQGRVSALEHQLQS